ncbi:putative phage tail assembly chaperone [Endozoicomonas ascidiicola]|uniref:putative phage tail assembly chaperone n=1 Tax=Endozoicomonas ascidiicola TaxID=1698521 RepID=UPI000830E620|nr:putative phage tail assembly chaperone [Endozoicomonas ascidiicola]
MSETKKAGKTVEVMMGETTLTFQIGLTEYNDLINKMQPKNKVQPAHNFMVRCSANDETRAIVKQCYEDALTMDLFGEVLEGYKPNVEFAVKK